MFLCERNHDRRRAKLFEKGVQESGNTRATPQLSKKRKFTVFNLSGRELKLQKTTDVLLRISRVSRTMEPTERDHQTQNRILPQKSFKT